MSKDNEFDNNIDLGSIKGNENSGDDMLDKFFGNLSDVPDSDRSRYSNEPRYKESHGDTLGGEDPLKENPGVNTGQFNELDGTYSDAKPEKDGLLGKLLLTFAGLTVVKKFLKGDKITDFLGDKIPFLGDKLKSSKNKDANNGEPSGTNASIKQNKSRLGIVGTIVVVTMCCALLYFVATFSAIYLRSFKDPTGGFNTAIEKVRDPSKEIDLFKTYVETQIVPYEKKEDGIIQVTLSNGNTALLKFDTSKDKGYVRIEIEKLKEGNGVYAIRATNEYNPSKDKKGGK